MSLRMALYMALFKATGNGFREENLSYYVNMMKSGKIFSFSRFGDGEWSAILGFEGENCDGHRYFPELGADLRAAVVDNKDYIYGIQDRAIKNMGKPMRSFLRKNDIHIQWHDADVFHRCDNAGTLFPLVSQLRAMKTVIIGPRHLRIMNESVFDYGHFIEIPGKNCYLEKKSIISAIKDYYEKNGPAVFCFSASMAANAIIQEIYPGMGKTSWLIDFGSLWDCYCGVKSRGSKSREYWDLFIKKNIGG